MIFNVFGLSIALHKPIKGEVRKFLTQNVGALGGGLVLLVVVTGVKQNQFLVQRLSPEFDKNVAINTQILSKP